MRGTGVNGAAAIDGGRAARLIQMEKRRRERGRSPRRARPRSPAPRHPAAATRLGRLSLAGAAALASAILLECAMVVCGYQLYSTVRVLVAGRRAVAIAHGALALGFERSLHLSFEQPAQHAALRALWLVRFCNYYYVYMYLPFIAGTAVVLFLRDRRIYTHTRRTFLISGAIGLFIFAQFPVAPPRLLPNAGLVDTLQRFYPEAGYASNHFANQYAAVPSFHVAWTVLAAISLWRVVSPRSLRTLIGLVPLVTLLVVIVTANHLWLDAAIGGLVLAVSSWLARRIDELLARGGQRFCWLRDVQRPGRLPELPLLVLPELPLVWPVLPLCYSQLEDGGPFPPELRTATHGDDVPADAIRGCDAAAVSVRARVRRPDRSPPRYRRRL
jgi:hypothetical protein